MDGGADRIRRHCFDINVTYNITYRKTPIEYKTYLMKCGHSQKDIDKTFCKRVTRPTFTIIHKIFETNSSFHVK